MSISFTKSWKAYFTSYQNVTSRSGIDSLEFWLHVTRAVPAPGHIFLQALPPLIITRLQDAYRPVGSRDAPDITLASISAHSSSILLVLSTSDCKVHEGNTWQSCATPTLPMPLLLRSTAKHPRLKASASTTYAVPSSPKFCADMTEFRRQLVPLCSQLVGNTFSHQPHNVRGILQHARHCTLKLHGKHVCIEHPVCKISSASFFR